MTALLISVFSFLIAIGILITVHEFGHFWAARSLGVKVLRFSVGFGKPLWIYRAGDDQTEYVIAAVPLGGYVSMLDDNDEEQPLSPEEAKRAFSNQSVGKRIAIILAGPVANILFAIIAYWCMFMIGITGLKPILGSVDPHTPASRSGFNAGEQIIAIEGHPTPTWEAVNLALLREAMDQDLIRVQTIDAAGQHHQRFLNTSGELLNEPGAALRELGLHPGYPPLEPVIGLLEPGEVAAKAGLKPGDRFLSYNGVNINTWEQWVGIVRAHPGQPLKVDIERGAQRFSISLTPAATAQGKIGRIGAAVQLPANYAGKEVAELRYPPSEALEAALAKVREMSSLTLRMLGKMLEGQASVENISGPISIAQLAGQSAATGLAPFLAFLGLVSLSLGVINLLPIPVLDGGGVVFCLGELLLGRPLPEMVIAWGQKIGGAILFSLMAIAIFNDLHRVFGL